MEEEDDKKRDTKEETGEKARAHPSM
jgi:hypothetical protein